MKTKRKKGSICENGKESKKFRDGKDREKEKEKKAECRLKNKESVGKNERKC